MVRSLPIGLLVAGLILRTAPVSAQGHPQPSARGTTPALSLSLGGGAVGIAAGALVGFRKGAHELAVRGLLNIKQELSNDRSESVVDAGVLYGLHPLSNRRILAIRAGVSGIWYTRDPGISGPERSYDPTVGFPVELALSFPVSRKLALGVTGTGNLNSVRRYTALLLTLTISGH